MNRTTMKQRTRRGFGLGLAALALLWIAGAVTEPDRQCGAVRIDFVRPQLLPRRGV